MMMHTEVFSAAQDDLLEIQRIDRVAAIKLAAVIEQMGSDESLQDRLLTHNANNPFPRIEVKRWEEQYRQGKNLWRVKVWESTGSAYPLAYRIVYAFKPRDLVTKSPPMLIILGVVRKGEFNYGNSTEIERRILADYNKAMDIF